MCVFYIYKRHNLFVYTKCVVPWRFTRWTSKIRAWNCEQVRFIQCGFIQCGFLIWKTILHITILHVFSKNIFHVYDKKSDLLTSFQILQFCYINRRTKWVNCFSGFKSRWNTNRFVISYTCTYSILLLYSLSYIVAYDNISSLDK